MSGAIPSAVQPVAVVEPIVALTKVPKYGVLEGPNSVGWMQQPASSVSSGNIQISTTVPANTIVDRRMYLQVEAKFVFTGLNPGGGLTLLDIGVTDALRAYPLTAVKDSETLKLNGSAATQGNINDMWPYLFRYHNMRDQRDVNYSITPAMLDQFQEYSQGLATNRNPLANYGDNTFEMPRGGWTASQATITNDADAKTATVIVTITEPLFLSPCIFARGDDEPGLYNIHTINYTATFASLSRMWSRFNIAGGTTLTSIDVTFNSANLLLRYLQPQPTIPIPKVIHYSYFNPVLFAQENKDPVLAGASATLNSSVIQTSGVPRRLYVWVSQVQADKTFESSDVMFRIDSVNLTWGVVTYLREASAVDLYNMAAKNGVNLSWPQWTKFTGGILCIDLGSDVGLRPTEAPGSGGKYQFKLQVQCTNVSPSSIRPAIKVVAVQEGVCTVSGSSVFYNDSPVTGRDVLDARGSLQANYKKSESVYGGDFFSDFVSGFKKGAQIAANIGEKVLPIASLVDPVAGRAISQYGLPALRAIGGRRKKVMGGMTRKMLRRRLRGRGLGEDEKEEVLEDEYEEYEPEDPRDARDQREREVADSEEEGGDMLSAADFESEPEDDAVSAYLAQRARGK